MMFQRRWTLLKSPEYPHTLADDINIDHSQLAADTNDERILLDLENKSALAQIFAFIGAPAMVIGRTLV